MEFYKICKYVNVFIDILLRFIFNFYHYVMYNGLLQKWHYET